MARSYSAMKLKMGTWDYFVVRMSMGDIATEIQFASEVNENHTLDQVLQRELDDSRSKKAIVSFLQSNEERFFGSIVVAALGGNPSFFEIKADADPRFDAFKSQVNDTFGLLMFGDDLDVYALDGQHRLKAIKELISNSSDSVPPPGFSKETLSVIFVIPQAGASPQDFKKSYRRLFTSLNRNAKPMSDVTSIIMDEDDRFAIITRYILSEYDFFSWDGSEGGEKIDTVSGNESMGPTSTKFATLVGLYKMNQHLLWSPQYTIDFGKPGLKNKAVTQSTPTDDEVEHLQNFLIKIWDCLLLTLPVLTKSPFDMRQMEADGSEDNKGNIIWFRPVGQTRLLAPLARRLMTENGITEDSSSEEIIKCLKPLSLIPDQLHHDLWRDFLIQVNPASHKHSMMTEPKRLDFAYNILLWLTGVEVLSEDGIEELQVEWSSWLNPAGDDVREDQTFQELERIREAIISL